MKLLTTTTLTAMLLGTTTMAGAVENIVAQFKSYGYEAVHIEEDGDTVVIEGFRGDQVREIVYDATTNAIISDTTETMDDEDDEDQDDDDDDDDEDEDADEDDGDEDEDADEDDSDEDDEEEDDEEEDSDDNDDEEDDDDADEDDNDD